MPLALIPTNRVATWLSAEIERFTAEPGKAYAIVVGHEVKGVQQEVVDAADMCIEIPQMGTKHSLNVSVSAAVALWHIFAQLLKP